MKKLKAAVISCGMIAKSAHIKAYQYFDELYDLVAVCDVIEAAAKTTAEEFGIPHFYTDAEEMLKREKPDVVSVCTPNMLHKKYTMLALEYGANVLCEKPLAFRRADAIEMFALAKEKGKYLMACQSWRFMPERLAAREMVEKNAVGNIYHAEISRLRRRGIPTWGKFHLKEHSGGGAFLDIGVHVLDSMLWLIDNPEPVSVTMTSQQVHVAELGDLKGSGALSGNVNVMSYDAKEINVETFASGNIRFANGTNVNFKTAWATNHKEENNIVLYGEGAGIDIEAGEVYIGNEPVQKLIKDANRFPEQAFYGHFYLIENMAKTINGEESLFVKPEETINLSAIMEAAYRSAELGRTVEIKELGDGACHN